MFNRQNARRDMEILVCVKRVPDTSENEIEINRDGTDIERDDLVSLTREAADVSGIPFIMDSHREEVERILG